MKIILAYSGGLDTSVILIWLKQNYDAEIIAFCADIGQEEELDGLTEKALRTGAAKCIIEDLREEFARDFIFPTLNKLGGKHGIGRVDIVENRFVGMKSRGVYETPGGAILHFAHRQMETLTMDREVMLLRDSLIPKYSTLVYDGFWFSPEREALQALVTETQRDVTGFVRLKLYKGNIIIAGRKSPRSLYDPQIATMESGDSIYDQGDATGFIRLSALRLKVRAALKTKGKGD